MIYEPAEDSYLLAEQVKKYAFGKVLDIGTGSGIQAKTAASLKKVKNVLAIDIQQDVVSALKKEKVKKVKVQKSNLFSNVKGRFDTIIFNPPYLPLDKQEPEDSRYMTTGGKHGYETLRDALVSFDNHLTKKGIGLILFSSLTHKDKVDEILESIGYDFELVAEEKISFESLYVYKIKRNWLLEQLFDRKVTDIKLFMKGHRGYIFTGKYKGKKIAIKAQRLDINVRTVEREAKMIAKLNKKGIAPTLLFVGNNYFAYEFIEGEFIRDFLDHSKRQETKKVFLDVLKQCRTLDLMQITKEEMHNPYKHVLVGKKNVLVDFERSHVDIDPKNVTQFCQYVLRNHAILTSKGMKINKEDVMTLTRAYKHDQSNSNYKKIQSFISAF